MALQVKQQRMHGVCSALVTSPDTELGKGWRLPSEPGGSWQVWKHSSGSGISSFRSAPNGMSTLAATNRSTPQPCSRQVAAAMHALLGCTSENTRTSPGVHTGEMSLCNMLIQRFRSLLVLHFKDMVKSQQSLQDQFSREEERLRSRA